MNKLITLLCVSYLVSFSNLISAQDYASNQETIPSNYKERSAVFDYTEKTLNNVDTIPDFNIKPNKIKITGTIYLADGVTPAKDVILYVNQPDEDGNYDLKKDEYNKRYVHHRGWVKTGTDGRYTLYTFVPGKFLRSKELKQIHRIIKEPGKPEYAISSFFFNDDPLIPSLTLACRAKAVQSMLRLDDEADGMYVATKDIKLNKDIRLVQ
jgi:protocatechuate 3,4-dioxygenase beta subunit